MANTEQLVNALKRVLRSRDKTYADLAQAIGLSEASVKRLFAEQSFSLQRLDDICRWLELDFFELARLARGDADQLKHMTVAQETVLASDRRLLGVFYMLMNNWQLADIVERYEISEPECLRLIICLDRAGLVELLPNNRVRLRVVRHLRHRPDGPIRQILGAELTNSFLSVRFDQHGGEFRFEEGELSPASAAILQRKIDRLAAEFYELSELDVNLPRHQRTLYGIAMGLRPWSDGEELAGFKRR
ncbi:MAG: helix-turn-helix transcriptional regulator [Pseudomonadota bacterium]|nr:helix-turn-helix transcriptional regulator [Pseudomonadota bacterium]